jgi:perosamine synthetase
LKKSNIELHTPNIIGNEIRYLKDCINKKHLTFGSYSDLFRKKISNITNSKFPALVQNCTSGLYLCLKVLNTLPEDEIIVPSISFIASINVIKYCNAHPVFMDVDEYCNLNIEKTVDFLKKETFSKNGFTYNKKTKRKISSVIVVHTFGNLANLNRDFINICKKNNINIIEDAAESMGSFYIDGNKKHHAGTMGTLGSISFNGNKIITSAGGGVVLSNNKKFQKKILYLANQAKNNDLHFIHNEIGYNFRLSNIHAAIGLAQIENLKKIINLKKKIHLSYANKVNSIKGLSIMAAPLYSKSNYWINILKIKKNYKYSKNRLLKKLNFNNIQARSVWFPNHLQKPYKKDQNYKIDQANKIFENYICLPSSSFLKTSEVDYITKKLR